MCEAFFGRRVCISWIRVCAARGLARELWNKTVGKGSEAPSPDLSDRRRVVEKLTARAPNKNLLCRTKKYTIRLLAGALFQPLRQWPCATRIHVAEVRLETAWNPIDDWCPRFQKILGALEELLQEGHVEHACSPVSLSFRAPGPASKSSKAAAPVALESKPCFGPILPR